MIFSLDGSLKNFNMKNEHLHLAHKCMHLKVFVEFKISFLQFITIHMIMYSLFSRTDYLHRYQKQATRFTLLKKTDNNSIKKFFPSR